MLYLLKRKQKQLLNSIIHIINPRTWPIQNSSIWCPKAIILNCSKYCNAFTFKDKGNLLPQSYPWNITIKNHYINDTTAWKIYNPILMLCTWKKVCFPSQGFNERLLLECFGIIPADQWMLGNMMLLTDTALKPVGIDLHIPTENYKTKVECLSYRCSHTVHKNTEGIITQLP